MGTAPCGAIRRKPGRPNGELLVAFQGVDETLLSPVHARWTYRPADLRMKARFEDTVVEAEDSRVLDFTRFHRTVPLAELGEPQAATSSGSR